MTTRSTYYKVVRLTPVGYCSAYNISLDYKPEEISTNQKWILHYELEKKITPKEGKIFAFLLLQDAIEFQRTHTKTAHNPNREMVILKGHGKKSRHQRKYSGRYSFIEQFWNSTIKYLRCNLRKDLPEIYEGSILLDHFTPTELIS